MKIHLVELTNTPILEQLQLEEALLRADSENWCLINTGSSPAIVMGISGQRELLVNENTYKNKPIPLIRRFSGGGTVVVDENTLFITLICNSGKTVEHCYPHTIHEWMTKRYNPLFENLPFQFKENDYILGDKKFGGNAQYIRKDRWLHHSSLLWDYCPHKMDYLSLPHKRPQYRADRPHNDFLCKLSDYFDCQKNFIENFKQNLNEVGQLTAADAGKLNEIRTRPHRKTTILL